MHVYYSQSVQIYYPGAMYDFMCFDIIKASSKSTWGVFFKLITSMMSAVNCGEQPLPTRFADSASVVYACLWCMYLVRIDNCQVCWECCYK